MISKIISITLSLFERILQDSFTIKISVDSTLKHNIYLNIQNNTPFSLNTNIDVQKIINDRLVETQPDFYIFGPNQNANFNLGNIGDTNSEYKLTASNYKDCFPFKFCVSISSKDKELIFRNRKSITTWGFIPKELSFKRLM